MEIPKFPKRSSNILAKPLSLWSASITVSLVGAIAFISTLALLRIASGDPGRQIEAVKTGLTAAAAFGGLIALLVSIRRQWSTEVANRNVAHDASERRFTELYVKAVDQLGSEKAPVRLAGLYALERLATANPPQRQAIVNVVCAYLRMPFSPPSEKREVGSNFNNDLDLDHLEYLQRLEEAEVRLTAQRILESHLKESGSEYWGDDGKCIDLDLQFSTLINFSLDSCTVGKFRADGARFYDVTSIGSTVFEGRASFTACKFYEVVFFDALFLSEAWFDRAHFATDAWFYDTSFGGRAEFEDAYFGYAFDLSDCKFSANGTGLAGAYAERKSDEFLPQGFHFGDLREDRGFRIFIGSSGKIF